MLGRAAFLFGRATREIGQAIERVGMRLQGDLAFTETLNRSRRLMALGDAKPYLRKDVFVAPNASVIGKVSLGEGASVWYGSVLRGDVNSIVVGSKSSIGDNCVVHVSGASNGAFGEAAATKIGDKVVVESGSILHGCELHDGCKVCAGSVVFDGAVIESGGVLSAGSMLTAGKKVPSGQLWAGRPAEFVRELTAEEKAELELEAEKMYSSAKKHEAEHTLSPQERYARADVRAETELRPNPNY